MCKAQKCLMECKLQGTAPLFQKGKLVIHSRALFLKTTSQDREVERGFWQTPAGAPF